MRTSTLLAAAMSLGAFALPASARADPAAEALFRQGRRLLQLADYAGARAKFAESLRLERAPGTLLNLADCEERMGRLATAWEHFARVADELPEGDERRALARERARALDHRVPRLTIALSMPARDDLEVWKDGVELRAPSLGVALPTDPGAHEIVARREGFAPSRYAVRLKEGEARVLVVAAGVPVANAPASAARTGAWALTGASALALATGAYFGVRALTKHAASDAVCGAGVCRDPAGASDQQDAMSSARVADVSFLVAATFGIAAGALFLVGPSKDARPPSVATSIHLTPTGLGGTF